MQWNVLTTLQNPKNQPPRNVRIAVLKTFRKLPRVLFYFLLVKALYRTWFPGDFLELFRTAVLRKHPHGCFWEYLDEDCRSLNKNEGCNSSTLTGRDSVNTLDNKCIITSLSIMTTFARKNTSKLHMSNTSNLEVARTSWIRTYYLLMQKIVCHSYPVS